MESEMTAMKDLERLTPRNATPFEYRLLNAARSETIPSAMKLRMSQGLNLGPTALAGSSATAVLSMKTVALAVIGAASLATLVGIARQGGGEVRTGARMRMPNEPAPTVVAAPTASPNPKEVTPTATKRPNANPAHPLDVNLRGEIARLDAARAALAAGDPTKAIAVLDHYRRRYPNGTFAPEAITLRIEALFQTGNEQAARTLAHRFLKAHPDSPLTERVERLAGMVR